MKVVAGIFEKDGKLLMFYSTKQRLWEFPGGKVEEGEDDVEALKREWKEELNCDIEVHKYFDSHHNEFEDFLITYYLVTPLNEWELKEHSDFKYLSPDDAVITDMWASDWLMVGNFITYV